jgi:ParB family chromosome partitioning protein
MTIAYRLPETKKPAKAKDKKNPKTPDPEPEIEETAKQRPDVTQKGEAMIGDYQTDALHEALNTQDLADLQLMAYLVMALAAKNVDIRTGQSAKYGARRNIVRPLVNQTAITMDASVIRQSAREMLAHTLSCRAQYSNSGIIAQIVGDDSGANLRLPNMATEEFLSCLSRQALQRVAETNGIPLGARVKDTRAAIIKHLEGQTWRYPQACFAPDQETIDDTLNGPSWEAGDEEEDTENAGDPTDDGEDAYSEAAE